MPQGTPRRLLLFALALLASPGLLPAPGSAQAQSSPDDEAAVMEVVERLFEGMRARDGEVVASVFHPQARLVSTGAEPDGTPRIQFMEPAAFAATVGQGGAPWNEPLFATEVRVDGNLAHVWTFYRFYAGERFSHCGHNSIRLVRTAQGWRIMDLADTRRTDPCDPPA